ncbi:hypothetical protein JTE90_008443 [Oedothorax gibbosus]|uniref:MEIOB-like N-terminal domain-containing protein n=1 Tax=Oedothorax gibbosus TaxID=931172 RepID=A0AAV6UTA0_9ARAC|nr:hypothetical protein JTE90_008443 [Oedothorax gibbosus]
MWISDNYGFDETDITYQKVSINQLSSDVSQAVVFGMVIAKQDLRRIPNKQQPGSYRYVLNFMIRDTPNDTINAACWGDESATSVLSSSFTIGDVVKIKNPQIIERQSENTDDKFKPKASSQYQLNISPQYSEITVCASDEIKGYEKLLHCAAHTATEILSLADVVYNSQNAEGLTVNLLVAIKEIGQLQTVKTKDGREAKKLQLSVFDQSHPVFPVLIWDAETAKFLIKYCSKRSVVLISDIKVSYNNFMKEMTATSGNTTIFTPEPDIPDARVLYQYAMKVILSEDSMNNTYGYNDPSTVYNVEQVLRIMNTSEMISGDIQGTLIAMISMFDLDGSEKISSIRCPGCLRQVQKLEDRCVNGACEIGSGMSNLPPEEMYDIQLSLADDSGCIQRCLVPGQVFQNLLGLPVQDFLKLPDERKTSIKWLYLFERMTIQFKVAKSSTGNGRSTFRVLFWKKWE